MLQLSRQCGTQRAQRKLAPACRALRRHRTDATSHGGLDWIEHMLCAAGAMTHAARSSVVVVSYPSVAVMLFGRPIQRVASDGERLTLGRS